MDLQGFEQYLQTVVGDSRKTLAQQLSITSRLNLVLDLEKKQVSIQECVSNDTTMKALLTIYCKI